MKFARPKGEKEPEKNHRYLHRVPLSLWPHTKCRGGKVNFPLPFYFWMRPLYNKRQKAKRKRKRKVIFIMHVYTYKSHTKIRDSKVCQTIKAYIQKGIETFKKEKAIHQKVRRGNVWQTNVVLLCR